MDGLKTCIHELVSWYLIIFSTQVRKRFALFGPDSSPIT